MAKTIEQLAAAATLDGTELVELQQGDLSVKCTTQDIADLGGGGAGSETTIAGDITGTDPVDVAVFPIPDTEAYFVKANVLWVCTDAGGGTTVVGEYHIKDFAWIAISGESVDNYGDDGDRIGDSMGDSAIEPTSVTDGYLQFTFTPPPTADAGTVISYKIKISGFGL